MKKYIIPALALTPALASAQQLNNFKNLLNSVGDLVDTALPIMVGIALLAFFWGLIKLIFLSKADKEAHEVAKKYIGWSLVALFVMVSVWGLVGFIGQALGIQQGESSGPVPTVKGL